LPVTNTVAYCNHSQITKKMKYCEYGPRNLLILGTELEVGNNSSMLPCQSEEGGERGERQIGRERRETDTEREERLIGRERRETDR
jgi:hypothetical protein